ncbi:MAG: aminotransferase class V-fold PLP-dependent enzyme [Oscillospiraceae bacterium]|nr:aminotransferase class V-fold PLP-dependent enzyme [Oscillospiraceae bacterium]
MIYLDSAATTLEKPPDVAKAMAAAVTQCASPGRGGYPASMRSGELLHRCRELAAALFDADTPEQVVLTGNATHGLNIAIRTLVKPGSCALISGYEHNAVTRVLASVPNVRLKVARFGLFEYDAAVSAFEQAMTDEVDTVICNHVSNVFGFILPVEEISQLCRRRGKPLIVDASQSAGTLPISLKNWGAAFIAMPGHKGLYGPQGTGLLLCGVQPEPLIFGGTGSSSISQDMPDFLPDRVEAGTQNVCGAAGLLAGMEFVRQKGEMRILRHECALRQELVRQISRIPRIRVFSGAHQSGVVSFLAEGMDVELVAQELAKRGIAVRAGLHCAPMAHRTAGTMETGTVRISFSAFNKPEQVKYAANALRAIVEKGRAQ